MNCNYKTIKSLNKSERDRLKSEITKWNKEFLENETNRIKHILTENIFKTFCVVCNNELGLGKSRILKIFEAQNKLLNKIDNDDWFLIDKSCKKILGEETYYKYFSDTKIIKNLLKKEDNI